MSYYELRSLRKGDYDKDEDDGVGGESVRENDEEDSGDGGHPAHHHGLRKRYHGVKRRAGHAHARLKRYRKKVKHEGHELHVPKTVLYVAAAVALIVIALAIWYVIENDWYADVKDFVIFPPLKTPLDVQKVWNDATEAVVSVATQVASGAVSVGTQVASGAVDVGTKIAGGAEDAFNGAKDFFGGLGKRDLVELQPTMAPSASSPLSSLRAVNYELESAVTRPTLALIPTRTS